MSTSRVIVGSTLAIQSLPISQSVPPIGELPTSVIPRPNVPIILSQNDSLFIRESIGVATVEERLDLEIGDNSVALTPCKNESSRQFGLSVDRPVVLAVVNAFSKTAISGSEGTSFKEIISQNLDLLNFENDLLQADYNFLMNKIEEDNEEIIQSLKSSLTINESSIDDSLEKLNEISFLANETSRILDFVRPENNFEEKLQDAISGINFRFDESRPQTSEQDIRQTSTSVIKRIEEDANADIVSISKAEYDLLLKLEIDGTAFSDVKAPASERTPGRSYDELGHLEKTIVCCKVLSKIMAYNFSKSKLPDFSRRISLPISISGQRQNFIFESSDVAIANASPQIQRGNLADRLSEQRLPVGNVELSVGGFHPEKSLKNNNYDSLITKAIEENAAGKKIIRQFEEAKESYKSAFDNAKFGQAVGFDNEACSPQDILLLVFKTIFESFPTYSQGVNSEINPNEMVDALAMSLGCRKNEGDDNASGLYRAILLASIIDPAYKFGKADAETFDSVTETKTTTNNGSDLKTIRSNSGTNQKGKGKVSSASSLTSNFYEPLEKRKTIPRISSEWVQDILERLDDFLGLDNLSESVEAQIKALLDGLFSTGENLLGSETKFDKCSKKLSYDSELIPNKSVSFNETSNLVFLTKSFEEYGSNSDKTTIKSSISRFYQQLILSFEKIYLSSIDESSFLIPGRSKKLLKTSIFDLIFECISNCLVWCFDPCIIARGDFEVYILSGKLSKLIYSVENDPQSFSYLYEKYESVRFLHFMKQMSLLSGSSILKYLTFDTSLSKITDLTSVQKYSSIDQPGSLFLKSVQEFVPSIYKLTEEYKQSTKNLATIEVVNDVVDKAVSNLLKIEELSTSLKESLVRFNNLQKIDVLRCCSVPSLSATSLKNNLRKTDNQSIEENKAKLDISAAKWFFQNTSLNDLKNSKIVFAGFPQGFLDGLTRQSRQFDNDTFLLSQEDSSLNKIPSYFKASSVIRRITNSASTEEKDILKFSHLIHAQQVSKIDARSTFSVVKESFLLYVFDLKKKKWMVMNPVMFADLIVISQILSLTSLNPMAPGVIEIVDYHIRSSIYESVAKVTAGLDISSNLLGTFKRSMSIQDAQSLIQIFSNDASNLLPRGSLKATDFLSVNPDSGFIEIIPYSKLKGESSNSTNLSEHALLTKIVNTRIFTKDSLEKEVLLPSAFERVYAILLTNEEVNLGLSQIVVSAIRN